MEIIDYVVLNNFTNFILMNFLNIITTIFLIQQIIAYYADEKNFIKYVLIGILVIISFLLFFLISKFINPNTKYLKIYYLKNNLKEITKSKKRNY